ncbi:MAG: ornithine cyclodeaminase family protein [Pirellulales bacterium]|nr:ornithine cyclodeaminase family protein [Pirellulales bacterium]
MTAIYLTEHDVAALADMNLALDAVEEAFRQLAEGGAENQPRRRVRAQGIVLHSMSAAAGYLGCVGWKQYTTTKQGAKFLVGLYGADTGQLTALIEADRLGRLRTGAATGVAAKFLAAQDAAQMGLIGTGRQAETQLAAVAAVRPLQRALVFSRDETRRQEFAAKMSQRLNVEVVAAESAQAAVAQMPIVVTATTSRTPVLQAEWLSDSALVCAVGSNALNRLEVDAETVRLATNIVCDDVEACRLEAAELVAAAKSGAFQWDTAIALADIVAGNYILPPGGVTLFKSVGLAIQDVALGCRIVQLATAAKAGSPLPF